MIKFPDLITLCNCLFTYEHFISKLEQNTRFASHGLLTKTACSMSKYGTNAFAASARASWDFFQNEFPSNNLREISCSQLKVLIKNCFFNLNNQISV